MSDKKEEKKEGAPDAAVDGEAKAPANKKKLLIMGGAGLLVVLLGAGGAFFFLSKGSKSASAQNPPEASAEAPSNENADGKKEDGKKPEENGDEKKAEGNGDSSKQKTEASANSSYGQTFALRPFHMNLGNPLENRYLRLEVSLEYKGGDTQKSELDSRTPQIRDIVVSTSSRKTTEFLLGPDGKDQLRYEIFTKLNQVLDKKVEAVYITDILVE
jgi:flagellar basal body-associated protein FliL